jgi:hypothetical protein
MVELTPAQHKLLPAAVMLERGYHQRGGGPSGYWGVGWAGVSFDAGLAVV